MRADDVPAMLEDIGAARRELGAKLQPEAFLSHLEGLARQQPGKAYVSLPGDWGRVLFVVKERDKFVGYAYGGGEVWTRQNGELDYFLAAPLGVQKLTREEALALLEKGGAA
ncbi:MAG: hypothetical protein A2W34_04045 [Chloroflexi bacterium RBG_16_64_32]|nr:MAG: hypothetical protein A2W34_04045 [Chloroflexi bacterium RBG_16_64_32]